MIASASLIAALVVTSGPEGLRYEQTAAVQAAPACLHDAGTESPEELARRRDAIGAARAINTAEAMYFTLHKAYASQSDLAGLVDARYNMAADPNAQILPGFTLALDRTDKGYWFEIKDTTDPCGFRFIGNQNGLILTAQPIR